MRQWEVGVRYTTGKQGRAEGFVVITAASAREAKAIAALNPAHLAVLGVSLATT